MSRHDPIARSIARRSALALAASLLLTLAACGGGGGGGGDETGTLDIAITGLPVGTAADIAVTGPGGFADALTASETLTDFAVGSYTVAAQPVDAPTPTGATYDPVVPSQSAAVVAATTTDVTIEYDLHECVMYEPTLNVGGDLSGQWSTSGEAGQAVEIISVPADPGGGYVTVRLQSTASMRPQLFVEVVPEASGGINFSGSQTTTDPAINPDPTLVEAVFEVAPGRTYQLTLRGLNAAGASNTLPQPFTASWSFTSRVDCYEPNDTLETAKAIPMENRISASFIAGFRDSNSIPATSEPTLDFYRFELHAPSAVRITLSDVADEVRPRLIVYDEGGSAVGSSALAPAAGESAVYESAGALPAAWYRVRVDTTMGGGRRASLISNTDTTIPPHFLQDYTLVVETLD